MPARVQLTPRRIQHSGKIGGRPVLARGLPPLVTEIAKDRDFRSTIEDLATSRRNSQGLSSPGGDLPKIFSFSRRDVRVGVSLHRPCFLHYSHISHCSRSVAGRQSVPVHPRKDRGMKSSQACPEWCHRQYLVPVTLHMLAASCPSRAIRPGDEILRLNGCPNTFCNALEKPHRRGAATRPTTLGRGSGAGFADQTLVAELVTARTP